MRVFHFLTAAQNGSAVSDSFVRIRGGMQISGRESALPFFPGLSQFPTGPQIWRQCLRKEDNSK